MYLSHYVQCKVTNDMLFSSHCRIARFSLVKKSCGKWSYICCIDILLIYVPWINHVQESHHIILTKRLYTWLLQMYQGQLPWNISLVWSNIDLLSVVPLSPFSALLLKCALTLFSRYSKIYYFFGLFISKNLNVFCKRNQKCVKSSEQTSSHLRNFHAECWFYWQLQLV